MLKRIVQKQGGMMTVEASVIVPVICLIFIGIVFLFLFFVDMSVAKSEVMRIASEAAASWKTGGDLSTGKYDSEELLSRNIYDLVTGEKKEMTAEAEKRLQRRINERLLITKIDDSAVDIGLWRVTARAALRFQWPLRSVEAIMGKWPSFSCSTVSPVDSWEEQLRLGASMGWK